MSVMRFLYVSPLLHGLGYQIELGLKWVSNLKRYYDLVLINKLISRF